MSFNKINPIKGSRKPAGQGVGATGAKKPAGPKKPAAPKRRPVLPKG